MKELTTISIDSELKKKALKILEKRNKKLSDFMEEKLEELYEPTPEEHQERVERAIGFDEDKGKWIVKEGKIINTKTREEMDINQALTYILNKIQ